MTRSHPMFAATLLGLVLFTGVLMLFPVRFLENDDSVMMMLASGLYAGAPTPHLVFLNYHLGQVLAFLYTILPGIDWYPGAFLAVYALCLGMVIVWVVARWSEIGLRAPAAGLAVAGVWICCIPAMQFTTVAGFATATGLWAILTSAGGKTGSGAGPRAIGAALILFGLLTRFDAAALVLLVSGPFALYSVCTGKNRLVRLGICVLVVGLGVGLHLDGARRYVAMAPDYHTFNILRGQINDNPNADLAEDRLPAGVSMNDYVLFRSFFPEPGEFTEARMRAILAEAGDNVAAMTTDDLLWQARRVFFDRALTLLVGTLLLAAVASAWARQPWRALTFAGGAVSLFLPLFYVEVMAILKQRVILSASLAALLPLLLLAGRRTGLILALGQAGALVAVTWYLGLTAWERVLAARWIGGVYEQQAEAIEQWPGRAVVFKNHFDIQGATLFTDDQARVAGKVAFAGWLIGHPANAAYTGHRTLLNEDTALLFNPGKTDGTEIGRIVTSLQENHGVTAEVTVVLETQRAMLVTFRALP